MQRARDKFECRRGAKRMKAQLPSAAHKQRAEALKRRGNDKLKEKQYDDALDVYNQSIELCAPNAVYHSNRAAANMLQGRFEHAVNGCQKAIQLDATFMRPRERLAHAYRQLRRHEQQWLGARQNGRVAEAAGGGRPER